MDYQLSAALKEGVLPSTQGDILNILAGCEGVYVRQNFNAVQALTGCQQQNVYWVFKGNFVGEQEGVSPLFCCQEKSECCQRVCLPTDCRAFNMYSRYTDMGMENLMEFKKEYDCVYCCFNRPQLYINNMGKTGPEPIGRTFNPCWMGCCIKGEDVFDENNDIRFRLRAECCQCANFFHCPCDSCQYLEFNILDPAGQPIGKCIKKSAGCFQQCLANTDHFQIQFPANASPKDKALILAAVILLDYRYFDRNRR